MFGVPTFTIGLSSSISTDFFEKNLISNKCLIVTTSNFHREEKC